MDKRLLNVILAAAKGRPYRIIRHVGDRLEIHYYGDMEKVVLKIGRNTLSERRESYQKTLEELQEIALGLGVRFKGLTKGEVVAAIETHLKEARVQASKPGREREGNSHDDLSE